jgi:PleD family two-component response regulator
MNRKAAIPTVVLISDTPFYPLFFKKHLGELYHFYLVSASTFRMEQVNNFSFALVVIDDSDLGENVFSLCREFRKRAEFSSIPILVITRQLKKAYLDRLILAGANDFIREPLDEEDLKERFTDVEKYRSLQGKLDGVSSHFFHFPGEDPDLHTHYLVNKVALNPIITTIKEGGLLCVGMLSIDQSHRLGPGSSDEIGKFLKSQLRSNDILFSLGLGSYMFFLDQTSSKSGFLIAETLRDAIYFNKFEVAGEMRSFTVSVGVAGQKRPPYESIKAMMMDAKTALMRAKAVGNQTIMHTE